MVHIYTFFQNFIVEIISLHFHNHCKQNFPTKLLFENCCEEFHSGFQHREECSYNNEEDEFTNEELIQAINVDICNNYLENDFSYSHDQGHIDLGSYENLVFIKDHI